MSMETDLRRTRLTRLFELIKPILFCHDESQTMPSLTVDTERNKNKLMVQEGVGDRKMQWDRN